MHANLMTWSRRALIVAGLVLAAPATASAQVLAPGICDFDIADDLGRFTFGSTMHLTGRSGASTDRGEFFIINADNVDNDVDHDGYNAPGPSCDFTSLFVPPALRRNLVNVENPSLAIPIENLILVNLPKRLPNGTMARVEGFVELSENTVAGRYVGEIQIRDSIYGVRLGPNNEILAQDRIFIEVTVVADRGLAIVDPDSARRLDSVVVRGRAGQRATGVARIANTGNTGLEDVRISATDLRSESAVGLVIPAENVTFSTTGFSTIGVGDTARVTITVNIPRGLLGGRYRGSLLVQGRDAAPQQIPLIVVVTSSRGILFGNNPVRGVVDGVAQIAFNGDPGTGYKVGIFDMVGLLAFETSGTVFAGVARPGTSELASADFAVNVVWPLTNGRGEPVASGLYLVVVESIVDGQRQLAKDRLMVIR